MWKNSILNTTIPYTNKFFNVKFDYLKSIKYHVLSSVPPEIKLFAILYSL